MSNVFVKVTLVNKNKTKKNMLSNYCSVNFTKICQNIENSKKRLKIMLVKQKT